MTETKPLALVTGASSGIGLELARQFAQHGFDLVVNAEDAELEGAAAQLRAEGAEVHAVQADLREPAGVDLVWTRVKGLGRPLQAAALNAGVGRGGPFIEGEWSEDLGIIELNVIATTHLMRLCLQDMVSRNEGRLLVTSSIASTMPGSHQSIYNASKSFVQSLTEAVQDELRNTDVTITSLMPGPTDTEFFERANMEDTGMGQGPKDSAAAVAEQGFQALMAGEKKVVAASILVKVQEALNRVLPDTVKAMGNRVFAQHRD
jgi:short-subunit dehydrogenase